MKILYLASSKGISGSSKALYNLVREISKRHKVCVVARLEGSFSTSIKDLGIECHCLPHSYLTIYPPSLTIKDKIFFVYRLLKYSIKRYRAYRKLLEIANNFRPDIIHTNVGPLDIGFKAAIKLGIKHVWHLREYQDLDFGLSIFPSKRNFLKKLSNPSNQSIAITRDIFNYWQLKKGKDLVIYDGVFDVTNSDIAATPVKENYFLFVGRIDDAKGVKFLLKAFGEFLKGQSTYKLLLAGKSDQKYLSECNDIIRSFNMENNVEFLGERTDVFSLMKGAVALLVPSRNEGFGFITAEAMFNHCPVIGRDTAGTKEQFDNGVSFTGKEIGFRFSDEKGLISALEQVCSLSSEDYRDLVENAYRSVKHLYNLQRHIEEVNSFYISACRCKDTLEKICI